MTTVTVTGSHGHLVVHRASGHVISATPCDCADCARLGDYTTYLWFYPPDLGVLTETGILYTSFVCKRGIFTHATQNVAVTDEYGDWFMPQDLLCLPKPKVTIILHGWHWVSSWLDCANAEDGEDPEQHQQHADEMPHVTPDGWCVYTRHEGPTDWQDPGNFDLSNEQDFDTYELALAEAQQRAADYGIEHMED